MSKRRVLKALSFCILFLLTTTVFAHGAHHTVAEASEDVPTVFVSPSYVRTTRGASFCINISIANANQSMYAWYVYLSYNETIIQATEVTGGFVYRGIETTNWLGYGTPPPTLGPARFTAKTDGNVSLEIEAGFFTDENFNEIDHIEQNGFVAVYTLHDLAVSLEVPCRLSVGEQTLLNATVFNIGRSDETNVKLLLFVGGEMLSCSVVPMLVRGSCYRTNYTLTSKSLALYNVTVFALPVFGENFTDDNVMHAFINRPCVVNVSPLTSKAGVRHFFTVNLTISVSTKLWGWQVKLFFEANVLNVTRVWIPQDNIFAGNADYLSEPVLGDDYVMLSAAVFHKDKAFSGTGTLCSIEFEVINEGESTLSFDTLDTFFLNETENSIFYFAGNGFFDSDPLGDVNKDGRVDLKDVYALGKAYGSCPTHERWNPFCDLNSDGRIDLKDYFTVCKNYGKSW